MALMLYIMGMTGKEIETRHNEMQEKGEFNIIATILQSRDRRLGIYDAFIFYNKIKVRG